MGGGAVLAAAGFALVRAVPTRSSIRSVGEAVLAPLEALAQAPPPPARRACAGGVS